MKKEGLQFWGEEGGKRTKYNDRTLEIRTTEDMMIQCQLFSIILRVQ